MTGGHGDEACKQTQSAIEAPVSLEGITLSDESFFLTHKEED